MNTDFSMKNSNLSPTHTYVFQSQTHPVGLEYIRTQILKGVLTSDFPPVLTTSNGLVYADKALQLHCSKNYTGSFHLFSKYLLSANYVADSLLGTGETAIALPSGSFQFRVLERHQTDA